MNQRPPRENRNAHRKNHQEEEEEECPRVSLPSCPAADDAGEDARRPLPALLVPSLWLYVLVLLAALAMPCRALCPNNCTCDDKALAVRCEASNIDVLPFTFNPALQQLSMYGTEIHTLDTHSLLWYPDLLHVKPKTFEMQVHLEELHLAQNNISELEADMFIGLSKLIVLSLRGNSIESLDGGVFIQLKQLKDLDLSENRIERLDNQALAGLSNLRVLHLRDNRLTEIPAQNLALVPDLAELSLGGNEFTEIKDTDFEAMRTLKDLDLSGTELNEGLSRNSLQGLSLLSKLNLEDCRLTHVPTEALSHLSKLEELHIGRNLFTTLPPDAFKENRRLHSLFVSGCLHLLHVEKDVLGHNMNIREVVITQNPSLTYIAQDAFRFLPELSVLDLHGNNLQQISEQAASWKDIAHWSLDGNPIKCNCSAAWLRQLTKAPNSSESVKCASPPHLAGKSLHSVELSDLACGMDPATQGLGHRLRGRGGGFDHCSHDNFQGYIMTPHKPVPVTEL
ncbi:Insulin-like growth factor-binding protein complex acid labile chain [Penaeus vannamei]|uniref:Insulin-like growth factor-binding protein complex acid labile chain n=1 Tax=Penaeus vannamei TaxID=6689 RepID=A0A3R7LUT4_PENVA|nr:Insulin-like growth factor-binding protein complex acid labile chain [Penaeus vannamei]